MDLIEPSSTRSALQSVGSAGTGKFGDHMSAPSAARRSDGVQRLVEGRFGLVPVSCQRQTGQRWKRF